MKAKAKQAFTLIELLVVISIILIASSIIFIGGSGGDGAALSSSQRIVSGIAQGARGQAILKNTKVRLIINNDTSDIERFRRFFGIVYEGTDVNGDVGWIAATQGTYLPEGIYFDATTSSRESDSGAIWSTVNTMQLDYPKTLAEAGVIGAEYYWYEFSSNGNAAAPNAYLVLRAATLLTDATGVSELRVDEDKSFLQTALIFRRVGTTTKVDEPDAITPSERSKISF
jgi:prepilin-type N-terminal cleavage/methylation domain-containing protein